MRNTNFWFTGYKVSRIPYVRELIEYTNDKKEGMIYFNGYYNVNRIPREEITREMQMNGMIKYDISLPQKLLMVYEEYEETPYLVNEEFETHIIDGKEVQVPHTTEKYKTIDIYLQEIEVYRAEDIEDTSVYSTIEDDDGEEMNVCFFPTMKMKLYFRVLRNLNHEEYQTIHKEFSDYS